MTGKLRSALPVVIVLLVTILMGYPLALLFGLPLARRDMNDLRKWQRETITALPVASLDSHTRLLFPEPVDNGLLVRGDSPLGVDYRLEDGVVVLEGRFAQADESSRPASETENLGSEPLSAESGPLRLVQWAGDLEPLAPGVNQLYRLPEGVSAADPDLALYEVPGRALDDELDPGIARGAEQGVDQVADDQSAHDLGDGVPEGGRLLRGGTVDAREVPEGERQVFSFPGATGPVIVNGDALREGEHYEDLGGSVRLLEAPAFGAVVRRVSGDYGIVDQAARLIVLSEPPGGTVRAAASVVRLAEILQPVGEDGRRYRFAHERLVEADRERRVFVGEELLSDAAERPEERVDGVRREFTFTSDRGIVVVDGQRRVEGRDFERDGNIVVFHSAPARNAQLRQFPDYFLLDAEAGEIELAAPPTPGSLVWTTRYTVFSQPNCGVTVLECFYALPQHPVPFPHWIAARVGPFLEKYPLGDERNVIWATLYTTTGTIAALGLGSLVGIVLAVLFVLMRPLERALLPWVIASQTVPIIALVPVLLLILGNFGITIQTSLLPTAIIGAYIAFFPMVVGTVKGLRSVDPLALDLMRSYAATPAQVFAKVRFPAAVPFFFTSLKLATAAALVGALVAETESNNRRGLGFQILGQVQSGNVADVWILLIVSALLGVGLVALIGVLQRLLAPWERT